MSNTYLKPYNRGIFAIFTVLGAALLCFTVYAEAQWGWAGVWPSIFVNLGTTLVLAFVLVWLERTFTKTAKREAEAAVEETRDEFSKLGQQLGTRIDELADQMRTLAEAEEANITSGLARLRSEPIHRNIVEMFETARVLQALDGSTLTVPTSEELTRPHLSFRWEPSAVSTGYDNIEYSGPRELRVTQDMYFYGRGSRHVVDVLWPVEATTPEIGMAVKNALVSSGEWAGDASFDWTHTLRMLAIGLELAIQSRRRTDGAIHLRGPLSEVLDQRLVMTTVGLESLDGRLLISSDEVPFHVQMSHKERTAWQPTSSRPTDITPEEWEWLSKRALERYEYRIHRLLF